MESAALKSDRSSQDQCLWISSLHLLGLVSTLAESRGYQHLLICTPSDLLPDMTSGKPENISRADPPRKSGPKIMLASISVRLLFRPGGTECRWGLIA